MYKSKRSGKKHLKDFLNFVKTLTMDDPRRDQLKVLYSNSKIKMEILNSISREEFKKETELKRKNLKANINKMENEDMHNYFYDYEIQQEIQKGPKVKKIKDSVKEDATTKRKISLEEYRRRNGETTINTNKS